MARFDDEATTPQSADNDFKSLAVALQPWFESEEKFLELPEEVRECIKRVMGPAMLPFLWDVSSPRQRRNMAYQYDIEHHPGLPQERYALLKTSMKINEYERIASNIPLENRTMTDVESQETKLRELHKEEAGCEAALQQKAKSFGRGWPNDRSDVCAEPVPEASSSPQQRRAGQDFREKDRVLAEEIIMGMKDAKGQLLSDWAACWVLAPRAEGKGTDASKQKRLVVRVEQLRRQKSCLRTELTDQD